MRLNTVNTIFFVTVNLSIILDVKKLLKELIFINFLNSSFMMAFKKESLFAYKFTMMTNKFFGTIDIFISFKSFIVKGLFF